MQTSLTRIAFHHGAKITEITERTVTLTVARKRAAALEDELIGCGWEITAVDDVVGDLSEIEVEDLE